jgi:cytochrome c oxidase cbb3-type subunit 1
MSLAFAHPEYNYDVVRRFCIMTVVWGIVGMAVGVLIAGHLAWPICCTWECRS